MKLDQSIAISHYKEVLRYSSMHAREHSQERQQRGGELQQPLSTGKSALFMLVTSLCFGAMLTAAGMLYVVHDGASGLLMPTVHVSRCGLSAYTQLHLRTSLVATIVYVHAYFYA